jgi:hypothetical protein
VVPNGIYTPAWKPVDFGSSYVLQPINEPMAALQSRFSVLSGQQNKAEEASGQDHDYAMGSLLTDYAIDRTGGVEDGISFDQVAADAFGANTPFRSMQLGVDNGGGNGGAYTGKVSWGNGNTGFPPILDPRAAFSRMFGLAEGLSEEEVAARKTMRASVLDRVLDRLATVRSGLATADLEKLDQYETGVRELELQIDRLDDIVCVAPPEPDVNPGFAEATQIMYDLMNTAFECDLTRYITFMQGPSLNGHVYDHLGLTKDDHTLSHNSWLYDNQDRQDRITMQNWQVQMYAGFVQKLADTTDIDGNDMLSNSLCVFTAEFGDANLHLAFGDNPVPVGLAGGENLGILQGQHRWIGEQSHANVWLGLLNYLGVEADTFGTYGTLPVDLSS